MATAWQQELIELFNEAPLTKSFGMTLSYDEQGCAHVILPYNPNLDHPMKGTHGGVIATMLDSAGWFAIASQNEGVWVTTSEFKVHLLNAARGSEIRAEGWVVKAGKRISVAEMRALTADGLLVAIGTGTFVVLKDLPFRKNVR